MIHTCKNKISLVSHPYHILEKKKSIIKNFKIYLPEGAAVGAPVLGAAVDAPPHDPDEVGWGGGGGGVCVVGGGGGGGVLPTPT